MQLHCEPKRTYGHIKQLSEGYIPDPSSIKGIRERRGGDSRELGLTAREEEKGSVGNGWVREGQQKWSKRS
jgi:hypothetical protein